MQGTGSVLLRRCRGVLALCASAALVVGAAGAAHAGDAAADIDVAITGAPTTLDLNAADSLVTYTVTIRNLDPTTGLTGGDDAKTVKLDFLIVDKPNQALPLVAPYNLTPTQGAAIRTITPSAGTCAFDRVATSPTSPSPPFNTVAREYGERVHCDLGDIAAGASVTVTFDVETNLNTFVVPQPVGAMVAVALVSSANEASVLDSVNNVALAPMVIQRLPV